MMGLKKAEMLNRLASDPKNRPDEIIKRMGLKEGQVIADVGAGGGYFSMRFSEVVGGEGRVYAVDTNPKFLEYIQMMAGKNNITNLITVLATPSGFTLPEKVDFVFMRNLTHHIKNRVEYFRGLREVLKPDGKVVIIDYEKSLFRRIFGHYVPKNTIIMEMRQAGYRLDGEFDILPKQHFTVWV